VLQANDQTCTWGCRLNEDMDQIFTDVVYLVEFGHSLQNG